MPKIRRGHDEAGRQPEGKVLTSPAPEEPGKFTGTRTVGDYVVLEWDTAFGTVGWAHSLKWANSDARRLADAVYGQFWDHMHTVYTALVLPLAAVNWDMAPRLSAIDLYPDCRLSKSYNVTWRQLAAILGTRAPWFPPTLRDLDTISAWKPGDPPAIIPANRLELPTRALIELAADEPEGSPAAAVCLWLARHIRRQDAEATQQYISEIQAATADPDNDCAYVHIAAVPAPLLRPEDNEPDEIVRRGGWTQIVERRDVLAAAAAQIVQAWDGGEDWPAGETAQFHPDSCPAAAEWTARLRPAPADQPPTVLERQLLENVGSIDRGEPLRGGVRIPGSAAHRPLGRGHRVRLRTPAHQHRRSPVRSHPQRRYGVDPHQRRRAVARALPAWRRPFLGIQRRRPCRPGHALGPSPRRHHQPARRQIRAAARPGIPN